MALIQIGSTQAQATTTVREMFARMAEREAEMIRAAREGMREHPARISGARRCSPLAR